MEKYKDDEWVEYKLEDVIESVNTGLDAIKRAPIVENDTGIKCLRIQDISQEKKFENWGFCKVSNKNFEKFQLRKDDIIIARTGATVGVNLIIKENLSSVYNNGLIRIRANKEICDPAYLNYQLKTHEYWGHIKGVALSTYESTALTAELRAHLVSLCKKR